MFEKYDFNVSISDYYQDYESGDYREIDVTASWSSDYQFDSILRVFWRVECKTSKGKPWVVFLSNARNPDSTHFPPIGLIVTDGYETRLVAKHLMPKFRSIIDELGILNPLKSGHGIRRVDLGEKEWKGNNPINAMPYVYVVTKAALE
jgi:hypothetical protein